MARTFVDTSSQHILLSSAPITDYPATLAAWFNCTQITSNDAILSYHDLSTLNNSRLSLLAGGGSGGDAVRINEAWDGDLRAANSTATYSANTWHHACGVFAAANSRSAYIDGGSKGTDTTAVSELFSEIDEISIGSRISSARGAYFSGSVAEAAMWNVALTDDEVASLGMGFSPLFVRPDALVMYLPLFADEDYDWISGSNFTPVNTPTTAAHPPHIIYPSAPRIILPAAAAVSYVPYPRYEMTGGMQSLGGGVG